MPFIFALFISLVFAAAFIMSEIYDIKFIVMSACTVFIIILVMAAAIHDMRHFAGNHTPCDSI